MKLRSPSLFWRTFLLIVLLIVASVLAWLQSFRAFEREPRAQQIASQVISIVNVTRSALLYSDPRARAALLAELADNEGIRIVPLEPADTVVALPDAPLVRLVAERIVDGLGPQTRLAGQVNGIAGIWVSFSIEAMRTGSSSSAIRSPATSAPNGYAGRSCLCCCRCWLRSPSRAS